MLCSSRLNSSEGADGKSALFCILVGLLQLLERSCLSGPLFSCCIFPLYSFTSVRSEQGARLCRDMTNLRPSPCLMCAEVGFVSCSSSSCTKESSFEYVTYWGKKTSPGISSQERRDSLMTVKGRRRIFYGVLCL